MSLQPLTDLETMSVSLGRLVRGGAPTAVDRYSREPAAHSVVAQLKSLTSGPRQSSKSVTC